MAFEERRVREADKLERNAGKIALIFGMVGVVTALEALLEFRVDVHGLPVTSTRYGVAGVALVLAAVIARGLVLYRRVGRLGTRRFRARYHRTWSFLAMTSTDALRQLSDGIDADGAPPARVRRWNDADRKVAHDLAHLWDEAPTQRIRWPWWSNRWLDPSPVLPAGRLRCRREVRCLARRVETFVCETLLVSERTPDLDDFPLPRLTVLYRLLSVTRDEPEPGHDVQLVSDHQVRGSLVNAGIPEDRWATFLEWERELLAHERRTAGLGATRLLEHVEATGLRHGLSADDAARVVAKMWADIHAWRGPTT